MKGYKHDLDHSWDEVEDAADELMDILDIDRTAVSVSALLAERLLLEDIYYLSDLSDQMSPKEREVFATYLYHLSVWRSKWGGEIRQTAPVAHALILAAIIAPLLSRFSAGSSAPDAIDAIISHAMREFGSCRLRYMPNDEITDRDLPRIRGELIEHIIISDMDGDHRRSDDNEFYAWLGKHGKEVEQMLGELHMRRSFVPDLVRELVGGASNPVSEGIL